MQSNVAKRIRVSGKRQITIPRKFHEELDINDEVECHIQNGALIITPVQSVYSGEFAEEILKELVKQGLSGEALIGKFKELNRKVRPAVEVLIAEADAAAAQTDEMDQFSEIFGTKD